MTFNYNDFAICVTKSKINLSIMNIVRLNNNNAKLKIDTKFDAIVDRVYGQRIFPISTPYGRTQLKLFTTELIVQSLA